MSFHYYLLLRKVPRQMDLAAGGGTVCRKTQELNEGDYLKKEQQ